MVAEETYPIFECFIHTKSQFRENIYNITMLQPLIMQFFALSIIRQVLAYGRLKSKENFKLLALKAGTVAYGGGSLK